VLSKHFWIEWSARFAGHEFARIVAGRWNGGSTDRSPSQLSEDDQIPNWNKSSGLSTHVPLPHSRRLQFQLLRLLALHVKTTCSLIYELAGTY